MSDLSIGSNLVSKLLQSSSLSTGLDSLKEQGSSLAKSALPSEFVDQLSQNMASRIANLLTGSSGGSDSGSTGSSYQSGTGSNDEKIMAMLQQIMQQMGISSQNSPFSSGMGSDNQNALTDGLSSGLSQSTDGLGGGSVEGAYNQGASQGLKDILNALQGSSGNTSGGSGVSDAYTSGSNAGISDVMNALQGSLGSPSGGSGVSDAYSSGANAGISDVMDALQGSLGSPSGGSGVSDAYSSGANAGISDVMNALQGSQNNNGQSNLGTSNYNQLGNAIGGQFGNQAGLEAINDVGVDHSDGENKVEGGSKETRGEIGKFMDQHPEKFGVPQSDSGETLSNWEDALKDKKSLSDGALSSFQSAKNDLKTVMNGGSLSSSDGSSAGPGASSLLNSDAQLYSGNIRNEGLKDLNSDSSGDLSNLDKLKNLTSLSDLIKNTVA